MGGEGPALRFADDNGVVRLRAGLGADGVPVVVGADAEGRATWSPLAGE